MAVGVYASPTPGERAIDWERRLVVRSHRYSFPSSLLTMIERVNGSTAAVLMHHSRTALGNWAAASGSGVGPAMDRTSFITSKPLDEGCGAGIVSFGSSTATRFTPFPPSRPA